jgi:hypothetical protein
MTTNAQALSESPMRFFTPELFLRVNSRIDEVADDAQNEWEGAVEAYRHHLKKVLRVAPSGVGDLARECFHDAMVVSLRYESLGRESLRYLLPEPMLFFHRRVGPATIRLTLPTRAIALVYLIWDEVRIHTPSPEWEERTGPKLWLYDEIDEVWSRFGMFVHRVLLSSGEVWEIPFTDVDQIQVTVPKPTSTETSG